MVHSYIPIGDREQMVIDLLIQSIDNSAIQRYLLSMDTSAVARSVRTIDEYLVIGVLDRLLFKAVAVGVHT